MKLAEAIAAIESCRSYEELREALQKAIEDYGFSGFNFMDAGRPDLDLPFTDGTSGEAWEQEYQSNLFVHVDHCVAKARRTNIPFTWDSVQLSPRVGKRRPGSYHLMDAAADHGFKNGLVVPYHFADPLGRVYSSLVVFFWKDRASRLRFLLRHHQVEMHLLMVYWAQRAIEIVGIQFRQRSMTEDLAVDGHDAPQLTDKEREVIAWAARGKTVADTADILIISEETVHTHMKSILRKLNATNKTHAVAKAIYLHLIDV